ncbi:hypothetical protein L873DRAFT_1809023 [Choiromyces venosus 120613-1]|uniref:Secreted protein n=1 Tax=Choiromyces venosus 120613-1 TaxID=1336337 RepID=A0A3N4JLP1_9PEZI|nr:hypothetical protein L873DRAFT_1809023 [Choiromyces venosus 120613-1]
MGRVFTFFYFILLFPFSQENHSESLDAKHFSRCEDDDGCGGGGGGAILYCISVGVNWVTSEASIAWKNAGCIWVSYVP